MIKNIYAIALFLPFGAFLTAKESMQDFFNRNHQAIHTTLASKNLSYERTYDFLNKSFNDLQPSLDTFLNEGGDINEFFVHPQDNSGHNLTMLMYAAQSGYTDLVRYALNKGANPLLKNNQGFTVFGNICAQAGYLSRLNFMSMDKAIIHQVETFGILLDAIDPQEHKNIFKPWIASFKYLISHSDFDRYNDMDAIDIDIDDENEMNIFILNIWNTTDDNKFLIILGAALLDELKSDPSLKCCKTLRHFVAALDDSEKTLFSPILKEYCQDVLEDDCAHEDPEYIQDLHDVINMLN